MGEWKDEQPMDLLILRHGIAVPRGTPGYPNDDRPLTEDGIRKMEKASRGMLKVVPSVDIILTSPLQRAHKTATIVAAAMRRESTMKICNELLPGTPSQKLLRLLGKYAGRKSIMLVGHDPDLSRCISELLGAQQPVVELKKGSLCCISVVAVPRGRQGMLRWHLTPKQLRLLAKS